MIMSVNGCLGDLMGLNISSDQYMICICIVAEFKLYMEYNIQQILTINTPIMEIMARSIWKYFFFYLVDSVYSALLNIHQYKKWYNFIVVDLERFVRYHAA